MAATKKQPNQDVITAAMEYTRAAYLEPEEGTRLTQLMREKFLLSQRRAVVLARSSLDPSTPEGLARWNETCAEEWDAITREISTLQTKADTNFANKYHGYPDKMRTAYKAIAFAVIAERRGLLSATLDVVGIEMGVAATLSESALLERIENCVADASNIGLFVSPLSVAQFMDDSLEFEIVSRCAHIRAALDGVIGIDDELAAIRADLIAQKWTLQKGKTRKNISSQKKDKIFAERDALTNAFMAAEIRNLLAMHGTPNSTIKTRLGETAEYTHGGTALRITPPIEALPNFELPTLGATEGSTLIYCLAKLAGQNPHRNVTAQTVNGIVDIDIRDYMAAAGIQTKAKAKKRLLDDAYTLKLCTIKLTHETHARAEKIRKPPIGFASIVSDAYQLDANHIRIVLGQTFAAYMANSLLVKLPLKFMLSLDKNKHPNAVSLLLNIWNQLRMEYKTDSNGRVYVVVSVRSLVSYCPTIPQEDRLTERQKKNPNDTFWKPLERTLDILESCVSAELCNAKGAPLTDEQLAKPQTWKNIRDLYMKIYPRQPYANTTMPELDARTSNRGKVVGKVGKV